MSPNNIRRNLQRQTGRSSRVPAPLPPRPSNGLCSSHWSFMVSTGEKIVANYAVRVPANTAAFSAILRPR